MKFSIITPTYNRADLIGRAIDSVIKQTYTNWEIIVIDDGSTDNTKEIIKTYLTDKRVRFITYPENRGVNHARNAGIDVATGSIIALLDSDDLLVEQALEKAKEFIETYPDYDIYFLGTKDQKTGKEMFQIPYNGFHPTYKQLIVSNEIRGEFWGVFKRHVFEKYKYIDELNGFEGITYLQMAKTYKLVCSTKALYVISDDAKKSLSRRKTLRSEIKRWENIKRGNTKKLSIFGDDLKKYNMRGYAGYTETLAVLGKAAILTGERKNGFKYTLESLKYNPFELRAWRNILLLVAQSIGALK